ncbi:helix-turn-helix domain-containing protein [Lysinibacillus sp. LZ02]|uniref:helix-turn-helix domain-containing protein n=1 Tax=Lysinibacillus sp. LZ02 TaxID=3420668 RepID=UPI003D36B86F
MTTTMSIATIVRTLRIDRNLSLRDLAALSGVTASYLSRIENDIKPNITINVLSSLCRALKADPKLFLDDDLQKVLVQPIDFKDFSYYKRFITKDEN